MEIGYQGVHKWKEVGNHWFRVWKKTEYVDNEKRNQNSITKLSFSQPTPGLNFGTVTWDLWRTKWHSDRFFSRYLGFCLSSLIVHSVFHIHIYHPGDEQSGQLESADPRDVGWPIVRNEKWDTVYISKWSSANKLHLAPCKYISLRPYDNAKIRSSNRYRTNRINAADKLDKLTVV